MLADRPVTGGYTAPACVIGADVGRVAQLRTSDPVTFALVTREDALRAWEEASRALSAVEPIGPDDHPGWAGAHD
jgi:allophanate hydrolase subunit 2